MKTIYNDIIPFKGYKAITIWPWLFVRNGCAFKDVDENHEKIHGEQQVEMLLVGIALTVVLWLIGCGWWSLLALPLFFWWYFIEWLVRIPLCGFETHKAYRNISFEQEAYFFQGDMSYLQRRSRFLWLRYVFSNKYSSK